jgi:hypothetical protein
MRISTGAAEVIRDALHHARLIDRGVITAAHVAYWWPPYTRLWADTYQRMAFRRMAQQAIATRIARNARPTRTLTTPRQGPLPHPLP